MDANKTRKLVWPGRGERYVYLHGGPRRPVTDDDLVIDVGTLIAEGKAVVMSGGRLSCVMLPPEYVGPDAVTVRVEVVDQEDDDDRA